MAGIILEHFHPNLTSWNTEKWYTYRDMMPAPTVKPIAMTNKMPPARKDPTVYSANLQLIFVYTSLEYKKRERITIQMTLWHYPNIRSRSATSRFQEICNEKARFLPDLPHWIGYWSQTLCTNKSQVWTITSALSHASFCCWHFVFNPGGRLEPSIQNQNKASSYLYFCRTYLFLVPYPS